VLNPAVLDEADVGAVLAAVDAFQRERGPEAAYRVLSGSQYRHPRGVQYGGVAPVWSNRVLRQAWAAHAGRAELAVFVDLHSGLGPRGVGLVLQTATGDSTAARLAQQWWPDVVRAEPGQGADAALVSGLIGPAFVGALAPAAAVGVVLEFGTQPMSQVILAVQADNWLHHHGQRDSARGRAIAQAMREAFFLDEPDWQAAVRERAGTAIADALAGMAAFAAEPAPAPRLRAARAADRDVLVEFARAMAAETEDKSLDPATLRAGTESLLADPARGRVYVIEDRGAVVASLMLTLEWSEWRNGFFWWIQSVYVHPAHRRRGFYRRLHEHVRALAAADPEVCGLRLYVERDNRAAQEAYRAIGMEETDYLLFEEPTRR
jgi:ribosomal protein S18 acetylase RimI-like enzyme